MTAVTEEMFCTEVRGLFTIHLEKAMADAEIKTKPYAYTLGGKTIKVVPYPITRKDLLLLLKKTAAVCGGNRADIREGARQSPPEKSPG